MRKIFCKAVSFLSLIGMILLFGCSKEIIQDSSGGNFKAINMATNDTLSLSGAITVSTNTPKLSVKNGNIVKLIFEPVDKYKGYAFDVKFTLHNGEEVKPEKNYEYEFALKGMQKGEYPISMTAKSTKQDISASSSFILDVEE